MSGRPRLAPARRILPIVDSQRSRKPLLAHPRGRPAPMAARRCGQAPGGAVATMAREGVRDGQRRTGMKNPA